MWWPLASSASKERGSHYINAVARLKPNVSAIQAQKELSVLSARNSAGSDSTVFGVRTAPAAGRRRHGQRRHPSAHGNGGARRPHHVRERLELLLARATSRRANEPFTSPSGRRRPPARQALTKAFVSPFPARWPAHSWLSAGGFLGVLPLVPEAPQHSHRLDRVAFSARGRLSVGRAFRAVALVARSHRRCQARIHDSRVRVGASRRTTRLRTPRRRRDRAGLGPAFTQGSSLAAS